MTHAGENPYHSLPNTTHRFTDMEQSLTLQDEDAMSQLSHISGSTIGDSHHQSEQLTEDDTIQHEEGNNTTFANEMYPPSLYYVTEPAPALPTRPQVTTMPYVATNSSAVFYQPRALGGSHSQLPSPGRGASSANALVPVHSYYQPTWKHGYGPRQYPQTHQQHQLQQQMGPIYMTQSPYGMSEYNTHNALLQGTTRTNPYHQHQAYNPSTSYPGLVPYQQPESAMVPYNPYMTHMRQPKSLYKAKDDEEGSEETYKKRSNRACIIILVAFVAVLFIMAVVAAAVLQII